MSQPLRLLLVEDSADDAFQILRELQRGGYEPISRRVQTAEEMRTALRQAVWDVIISDFNLPAFGALPALQVLHETGLDIPFLVISGTIGEDTAIGMLKAGAHDYLLKDNLKRLIATVERELREAGNRAQRRTAEAALRESEERYRLVSELTSDFMYAQRVAADGTLTSEWVTPAVIRITGYYAEELEARGGLMGIVHPEDLTAVRDNRERLLTGQTDVREFRIFHKSGALRWLRLYSRPIWDDQAGRVVRVFGAVQDITENRQAEAALRENEQRFQLAARATSDVIWDWDLARDLRMWSPGREGAFGYATGQGRPSSWWEQRLHPEDRSRIHLSLTAAITGGEKHWSDEYRFRRADGTYAYVQDRGYVIHNAAGQAVRMVGALQDITEQHQAAAALRASETRFRAIFEQSPDALLIETLDDAIADANPAACRLFGYSVEELRALTVPDLLAPERREAAGRIVRSELAQGGFKESLNQRRDGTLIPVEVKTSLLTGTGDGLALTIVRDITDRQREATAREEHNLALEARVDLRTAELARANAALRTEVAERRRVEAELAQERDFALQIVNAMGQGLSITDIEGRFEFVNPAYAQLIGRPAAALIGQPTEVVVAADDHPKVAAMRERRTAGETTTYELRLVRPDDSPIPVLVTAVPRWRQGEVTGAIAVITDLRELKAAEAALNDERSFAQQIMNSMGQGLAVTNLAGYIEYVNPAGAQLLGEAPDALIGRSPESLIWPEDLGLLEQARQARRTGQASTYEVRLRRPDGTALPVLITGVPRRHADGRVTGAIVTLTNLTERKRTEEAIQRLNANLAQKNRELEAFTHSVSHDLKAPLRGIDGYSLILQEDYGDRLDDEARRFLSRIRSTVQQMNTLIDDLLAYSRIDHRPTAPSVLAPATVVEQLLREYANTLADRGCQVQVALPAEKVLADPDFLRLALRQLVDNAVKFTAHTPAPVITIGGQAKAGVLVLWVRDNGVGFDMKYHDRLFEVFQRLHRVEDFPGTGVGLALARKALERLGGRVWAESAPEQGATFFVELPLAPASGDSV